MAVLLLWEDENGREMMEQTLIAAVGDRQGDYGRAGETFLELQATFVPKVPKLSLNKTNFGFLAVRMAKSVSAHFGGGKIINAHAAVDEPAIFGKASPWMDYSGPVVAGAIEGVTYFDHPANASYPSKWHVRKDGWMGASVCRDAARQVPREQPLVLRYLLHLHAGALDAATASNIAAHFGHTAPYELAPVKLSHQRYEIRRAG